MSARTKHMNICEEHAVSVYSESCFVKKNEGIKSPLSTLKHNPDQDKFFIISSQAAFVHS